MFIFWYVLKLLGCFRVNAADEAAGLDASHHGGSAYPVDLDDDASHKGSSYNGNQSGYNKVSHCSSPFPSLFCGLRYLLIAYGDDITAAKRLWFCNHKSCPNARRPIRFPV